jgi:hypothetical protein
MDNVRNKLNSNLAKPDKTPKFESTWKPQKTSTKEIYKKIMFEAEIENRKPNAFRINLMPIVIDKTHAKMTIIRGDKKATVEFMYPNSEQKITLKTQLDGAEDRVEEIGLEDEQYVGGLGKHIIMTIDELIKEAGVSSQGATDDYLYGDAGKAPSSVAGFSPNWEVMGESDSYKMQRLMSLVEAEDKDDLDLDLGDDDLDISGGDAESSMERDLAELDDLGDGDDLGDLGDLGGGGEFGADDFDIDATDAGADTEMGDFGGGGMGGLGDLGGGGGEDPGAGDVNAEEGGMEEDVEYMAFDKKADWLNGALNAMTSLVASDVQKKMSEGSGVAMTSDEILNGKPGIKGLTNHQIIENFLKVYPELDKELTLEQLDRIDEQLDKNEGEESFRQFLQKDIIPDMEQESQDDVGDVLDNSMFDEDAPMGGEGADMGDEDAELGGLEDELGLGLEDEVPDEETPEFAEAENEIGEAELEEFPNVGDEGEPEEEPEEEEK